MTFRNDQERDDWKTCFLAVLPVELAAASQMESVADQYVKALRERAPKQTVILLEGFGHTRREAIKGIQEVTRLTSRESELLLDRIGRTRAEIPGSESFTPEHTKRVRMILDSYGIDAICEDVQN